VGVLIVPRAAGMRHGQLAVKLWSDARGEDLSEGKSAGRGPLGALGGGAGPAPGRGAGQRLRLHRYSMRDDGIAFLCAARRGGTGKQECRAFVAGGRSGPTPAEKPQSTKNAALAHGLGPST
jgi:hypothetical protein